MKDKHDIERYFFNKLKELYPGLPDGIIRTPDPPDFIIEADIGIIAVEITEIHNEKESTDKFPPAQKHATEDRILERAQSIFSHRSMTPLHITFHFNDNLLLKERQIENLAERICQLVESEIKKQVCVNHFSFSIQDGLPDELRHVSGHYFPNITDVCWCSAKGKFLPRLTKREILNVIKKKEKKINQYRGEVATAILVIAEGLIPNSWFDDIERIEEEEIKSEFDKIFIIRCLSNQLVEIK